MKLKIYLKALLAIPFYFWNLIVIGNTHKTQIAKWYFYQGEQKHLINHNLNSNSIVFDVGGYLGIFSDAIIQKYDPNIYIFEPIKEYVEILESKYKNNTKVHIINKGLSSKASEVDIHKTGETSSLYLEPENKLKDLSSEKIELIDISEVFQNLNISSIDLCSINIEGAEYDLLDAIISRDLIQKIKVIQIQFHQNIPEYKKRRKNVIKKLLVTHNVSYSFPYVWECFSIK